jgi:hypothetical protein
MQTKIHHCSLLEVCNESSLEAVAALYLELSGTLFMGSCPLPLTESWVYLFEAFEADVIVVV